jgi:hypothetical protein
VREPTAGCFYSDFSPAIVCHQPGTFELREACGVQRSSGVDTPFWRATNPIGNYRKMLLYPTRNCDLIDGFMLILGEELNMIDKR